MHKALTGLMKNKRPVNALLLGSQRVVRLVQYSLTAAALHI